MRERPGFEVGVDLLDDRVSAVGLVRHHGVHVVRVGRGEERVVPPGVEQCRLLRLCRVQVGDPADHQPSRDAFGFLAGAERGEVDLGDLGFGDQLACGFVTD